MISHIDHPVLTVSDIERAVAFYSSAFKMEPITFGAGPPERCVLATRRSICSCWGGGAQPGAGGGQGISAPSPARPWIR